MILDHAPLLQEALNNAGNTHNISDVFAMIADGRAYAFPLKRSIIVCDQMRCPNENIWRYWLAAGELQELKEAEANITPWAKDHFGVKRSMIFGRPGWSKIFAPTYRETHRVLLRDI